MCGCIGAFLVPIGGLFDDEDEKNIDEKKFKGEE